MIRQVTKLLSIAVTLGSVAGSLQAEPKRFELDLRRRVETSKGSGRFHALTDRQVWEANQTAVIVCDMWDLHHCLNATRRGAEMAPRMNQLLKQARARGATIIHAPSSCLEHYKNHPARRRVHSVPKATNYPKDISKWCYKIPSEEQGEYPIDQSDGGEDDDPLEHQRWAEKLEKMGRNPRSPWKSQTDLLDIADEDFISDNGEEVWSILEHRGIDNVILVGVHTNMCVLGRPFGLRNMARAGKNVVLMRDMTDTMYNPLRAPYVSHFTGTDLIVEHIEKWVCPTVTSDQVLGGSPFQFSKDQRPHLVILMAEREYRTEESLPEFARKMLGHSFKVSFVFANAQQRNDLPGIDAVESADVLLISVRRRVLPKPQMQLISDFIEAGKPVVGIRTANHAFSLRGTAPPSGLMAWDKFDQEVIGGNYSGHHPDGPRVKISVVPGTEEHPILSNVNASNLTGFGSLYKVSPLRESARAILLGRTSKTVSEPIAWTNKSSFGGKVFYTSLGHKKDFEQAAFRQLLSNALHWSVDRAPTVIARAR